MVFSEGSLSAAASGYVPTTYFVCVRVSEGHLSIEVFGQGAALWHPWGACPKKPPPPHKGLLVDLSNSDALLEFCNLQRVT